MTTTHVTIVSPYGLSNAGVRARAIGFLDRLDTPWSLVTYFGGNAAGSRQFLQRPHQALAAEARLRRLARRRPARLLLRREASPLSNGNLEASLLRAAGHGMYDLDDALHEDVRGRLFERLFSKGRKADVSAATADVVVTGNAYLADWASERARDVRVIPTCVDPVEYTQKTEFDIAGRPRLVWLGTPSGERYLSLIAPALHRLHNDLGATLTIIGETRPTLGELEAITTRLPWDLRRVYTSLAEYDLGIMPLADTSYERGKCAYKLLEYGAAALPSIGSPVGVNDDVIRASGGQGPRTAEEWYDLMHATLTAGVDHRRSMGQSLQRVVDNEYSFRSWIEEWRSAMAM